MHFSFVRIIVDVHFRIMMWQFITRGYSGVCACFLESVCYRVKEIRVCALACLRALTSFSLFLNVWSAAAWTPRFCKSSFVSLSTDGVACFCCRAIDKAISAAVAADNQTPFVNKDLCTRKSVKRSGWEMNDLLRLGKELSGSLVAC